jgi:hypothetical protein
MNESIISCYSNLGARDTVSGEAAGEPRNEQTLGPNVGSE